MQDLLFWIWLSLACSPGSETFSLLYRKFNNPRNIYEADLSDLKAAIGSRSKDFEALSDKSLENAESILDFCRSKNVGILVYSDERYPQPLREISNPPVLLYYRGFLPDFSKETLISIVGTRSISDYGRKNAFTVSRDLAKAGATIVSGMAIGIDGVALAAALSESALTIAVLGCGIDICYPSQHLTLAREIVKRGCIFTEYPPKTPPTGTHFPVRNRIISALSMATVVIEGKERSGAMITARHAKEQGRPVYALPGNVGNKNSELTNLLIKNGARAFSSADDIVSDFDTIASGKLNPFKMQEPSSRDMNTVLRDYCVAAVAPGDKIFNPPKAVRKAQKVSVAVDNPVSTDVQIENVFSDFDKSTVDLYKKIPLGEGCAIEALVDGQNTLRDVMRLLLKLEVGRFVTMLPGERVRRNF